MLEDSTGFAYTEMMDGSFWIVNPSTSTSQVYVDGMFVVGPQIDDSHDRRGICVATVAANLTFYASYGGAYLYDWSLGEQVDVSIGFDTSGYNAQCGAYTDVNGRRQVVVAGGVIETTTDRSKILDVGSRTWREGPPLPIDYIYYGRVLQQEDNFLIVGGVLLDDGILEFNPLSESWVLRQERLSVGRDQHFMVSVDADYFC